MKPEDAQRRKHNECITFGWRENSKKGARIGGRYRMPGGGGAMVLYPFKENRRERKMET